MFPLQSGRRETAPQGYGGVNPKNLESLSSTSKQIQLHLPQSLQCRGNNETTGAVAVAVTADGPRPAGWVPCLRARTGPYLLIHPEAIEHLRALEPEDPSGGSLLPSLLTRSLETLAHLRRPLVVCMYGLQSAAVLSKLHGKHLVYPIQVEGMG